MIRNNDNTYCDYAPVNTLLEQFSPTAEQHGIRLILDIDIQFSILEEKVLLQMLTAALELGVDLCDALPKGREKSIRMRGCFYPRWCIAVEVSCRDDLRVDDDGFPLDENGNRDSRAVYLSNTIHALGLGGCLYRYDGEYTIFILDPGSDGAPPMPASAPKE